jgi:hypothetical protein
VAQRNRQIRQLENAATKDVRVFGGSVGSAWLCARRVSRYQHRSGNDTFCFRIHISMFARRSRSTYGAGGVANDEWAGCDFAIELEQLTPAEVLKAQ